tara:strand:+ start:77 stop:412 length:336 start_codon:yes stop_codon:yes gene_type:complete
MNNIEINSIEDIGFSNPNSRPKWNNYIDENTVDRSGGGSYKSEPKIEKPYFGQLNPDWRKNAQKVLDEQQGAMKDIEDTDRVTNLPKEILIFGGGTLLILAVLVIYKYKKK